MQNPDPVRDHLLRFLDGRLFQIVSNYDSEKIEGMTAADLIDVSGRLPSRRPSPQFLLTENV